jgi:hypothetical protein
MTAPNGDPTWFTALYDQILAARERGDYDSLAAIALDGEIRAYREGLALGEPNDLQTIVLGMAKLPEWVIRLVAAEAVRRGSDG